MLTLDRAKGEAAAPGEDAALAALLGELKRRGYRFVTPGPPTHARVLARGARAEDPLRDLLGWSRPADPAQLDGAMADLLAASGAARLENGRLVPHLRVSSLDGDLFAHSAYPTSAADAVFFGPDTYRFARWLKDRLDPAAPVARFAEIGTGSGAGGVTVAGAHPQADGVLTDINPAALRLARVNAAAAGRALDFVEASGLDGLAPGFDLIVANPPYIADADHRAYRDGGDLYGAALSLDWARQALAMLAPGGRFFLYTGAPVVEGRDVLQAELQALADAVRASLTYEEIDPDVWGEELERPEYADVERIAVAGAALQAQTS